MACVCKVGVLYRRGLFVVIFRSEECDAARTRKRPEDPSETRKEHQALEGPHQNAARRSRQDQAKISPPQRLLLLAPQSYIHRLVLLPWLYVEHLLPRPSWCHNLRHMKTLPVVQRNALHNHPIPIRAHTLLCLQGFRGEGYSAEFVDNMAAIHQRLADDPAQWVEIKDAPDAMCGACPHLRPMGCSLHGTESEPHMQAQDHDVLVRLGLHVGDRLPWADILDRIRTSLTGESLTNICGQCRWLSLGYCRDGIERLRAPAQYQATPLDAPKDA